MRSVFDKPFMDLDPDDTTIVELNYRVDELQSAYTAEMLLNGELAEKIKELEKDNENYEINTLAIMKERDKATTQLVSYEATIGHLKEALEDIANPEFINCPREKARKCLLVLNKRDQV